MRLLLYFSILFITNSIFSQKNTVLSDKEYQKLHDKARMFINSDVDSSFIYANKIEKSNNYLHQAFAVGLKSYLHQIKGDSTKSRELYKRSFDLLKKTPVSNEKTKTNAYLLNYGGLAEWKRGNFSKALAHYQEGKILSEKANDLKQVVKFNDNISLIYAEVANYSLAIRAAKESDRFTNKIEYLFTEEQFVNNKSHVNFNLGNYYKKKFSENRKNMFLLDSAEHYFKKAILFSKYLEFNKVSAEMNLGNVYLLKGDYDSAKKIHHKMLTYTNKEGYLKEYSLTNRNLGELYFVLKEYDKALIYFQKVDSIYETNKTNVNAADFINSNYFQAKIWAFKKDYDKALNHSQKYLENFEKVESKLNEETISVNYILSSNDLQKEMRDLQKEYRNKGLIKNTFYGFLSGLFALLVFILLKNRRDKKLTDSKLNELILQHKEAIEKGTLVSDQQSDLSPFAKSIENVKKENTIINIDEEKENEILEKLKKLEDKLFYLNSDFTQQFVAKKIKTNTTYLSYVVNKRFGKSFSEYSNELKINYVINEMIANPTYRKYSTQAIAESVGFKNAVSFTKSFSKRTGVTPVQFAKKLDSTKLDCTV